MSNSGIPWTAAQQGSSVHRILQARIQKNKDCYKVIIIPQILRLEFSRHQFCFIQSLSNILLHIYVMFEKLAKQLGFKTSSVWGKKPNNKTKHTSTHNWGPSEPQARVGHDLATKLPPFSSNPVLISFFPQKIYGRLEWDMIWKLNACFILCFRST